MIGNLQHLVKCHLILKVLIYLSIILFLFGEVGSYFEDPISQTLLLAIKTLKTKINSFVILFYVSVPCSQVNER